MADRELSNADFQALYKRLRGHAQWGSDDRRGALNHLTPARMLAAASEVKTCRSVTMAAPMAGSAADNPEPGARHMKHLPGEPSAVAGVVRRRPASDERARRRGQPHRRALSRWLSGGLYNGAGWLEPGDQVTVADLAAAQQRQQVEVGPGDLLFVRVGHRRRREELAPWDAAASRAGLHPQVMQLEDLLGVCQAAGRWSFLCVIAPLRLPGGTGSPVNPIAIL